MLIRIHNNRTWTSSVRYGSAFKGCLLHFPIKKRTCLYPVLISYQCGIWFCWFLWRIHFFEFSFLKQQFKCDILHPSPYILVWFHVCHGWLSRKLRVTGTKESLRTELESLGIGTKGHLWTQLWSWIKERPKSRHENYQEIWAKSGLCRCLRISWTQKSSCHF